MKQGDFIHVHDEITATDRSFVVLQLADGAKVTLRPVSLLVIEQYQHDAATLKLVAGSIRVVAGTIVSRNPENYRIRTPLGLMGMSGSESSLTVCGDKICDQQGLVEIEE